MSHFPRLILLAILIVLSMAAAFFTWRTHEALEGFDETEAQSVLADGGSAYERRIYIMKLFDVLLKRKATSTELHEYALMDTDAEVLKAIMTRFNVSEPTQAQNAQLTETSTSTSAGPDNLAEGVTAASAPASGPDPGPSPSPGPSPVPTPLQKPKGEVVCLDKADLVRNIQDIMDHLASFRSSISS